MQHIHIVPHREGKAGFSGTRQTAIVNAGIHERIRHNEAA